MVNDIASELRYALQADTDPWDYTLYERAAAEIERLRAENALLLEQIGTQRNTIDWLERAAYRSNG